MSGNTGHYFSEADLLINYSYETREMSRTSPHCSRKTAVHQIIIIYEAEYVSFLKRFI